MAVFHSIGVMSGTSLDGIDMVEVVFELQNGKWQFTIGHTDFLPYTEAWRHQLSQLMNASALQYVKTNNDYGLLTAGAINSFMERYHLSKPDVIGVHGHTIFHHPAEAYTTQIGNAAIIAAQTKCLVASDFRSMDVARGGQGAPLVPIGDQLLFADYSACMNIGGFANISFNHSNHSKAFDIGPANIVMNPIARKLGFPYDDKGMLARQGYVDTKLLKALDSLDYYQQKPPKSLGKEWVDNTFLPLISKQIQAKDVLRTLVEHISNKIAQVLNAEQISSVLLTGGGAFNDFLIERVRAKTSVEIVIPSDKMVEMKEAVIFAFLGVLRLLNRPNIISENTGAAYPSISGALYNGQV